jgi:hypothetical protein
MEGEPSIAYCATAAGMQGDAPHFVSMKKGGVSTDGRYLWVSDLARVGDVEQSKLAYRPSAGAV